MKTNVVCLIVFAAAASMAWSPLVDDSGAAADAPPAPAFDRKVNLVYTVNNLGYTDTCG